MIAARPRPSLRPRSIAGIAALAAALAAPARADVVVTRTVRADAAAPAAVAGACAAPVARPLSGEKVTLSVAGSRARRDEGAVSFVVDLAAAKAWVVDHRTRTYAELGWPPAAAALADTRRRSLGADGDKRYPFKVEGSVYESVANLDGGARVTRAARVADGLGTTLEVETELAPDAALGRAALAVETFAQAVRGAGASWLAAIGAADAIPLALAEEVVQRGGGPRYRESGAAPQPAQLDPALFAPPAGYARAELQPDCF